MKYSRLLAISVFLFFSNITSSKEISYELQTSKFNFDTIPEVLYTNPIIPYQPENESAILYSMFQAMNQNSKFSYLMINPIVKQINGIGELEDNEGGEGYSLEPRIYLDFPIFQGKSASNPLYNTGRLLLNYEFQTRTAKSASSPILPPTNSIGLQFDKIIAQSNSNYHVWKKEKVMLDSSNYNEVKLPFSFTYFSVLLKHYSNGQDTLVKDINKGRNDYQRGDFSTNFLETTFTYSKLYRNSQVLTLNLGYRLDFGPRTGNIFKFNKQQEKSYGQHRIIGMFQYISRPYSGGQFEYTDRELKSHYLLKRLFQIKTRIEVEYILGDLSLYPHKNNKYRFGVHTYLEYKPLRWRAPAILFHAYAGRDYLNIRYDSIIWTIQVGVSFSIINYKPQNFDVVKNAVIEYSTIETKYKSND